MFAMTGLLCFWYAGGQAQSVAPGASKLPGARPVVQAIDFPTLQAAIDALPPSGGEIQLPAGVFEISQPLTVHQEDVCLRGTGTGTHIKNVNEEGAAALVIRPKDLDKNPKARQWRVQVADLRITGNPKSGNGIEAHYVEEIFIHGVTVSYHGRDGIHLNHCYEDPRICDSLITYNKQNGLHLIANHDIVVVGNHFEENQDAVKCVDSFNLCMTGNNLDDHLGDGVVIENTYGSVVSGNMIEECNGTAIVLDRDCYGITLSSNVIAHHIQGGIDLRDAHGCAVSANTFTIVKANALRIGPASGRITVTGNNFSDSYIGTDSEKRKPNDQQATGIILDAAVDIAITGNVFSGLDGPAVQQMNKPQRIMFSGNVLRAVEALDGLGQAGANLWSAGE